MKRAFFLSALFCVSILALSSPAQAQDTFDISVKHNINGRALGLEKDLPVDVYINGDFAFTFNFGDTVSTELPAGVYAVDVNLSGTGTTVMSLPATPIPAGVQVTIRAQLSANKTPTLNVGVK